MADTVNDTQKALEKQISELRSEFDKLSKSLAERGSEAIDTASEEASNLYEAASERAARTADQLRSQAYTVRDVARENPGATGIVLGIAGLAGLLIGLAISQSSEPPRRRYW